MKFYHYKYWTGEISKPFTVVSTNKGIIGGDDDYVIGIKSNMVLVIVDKDNELVWDGPAPKELRPIANQVKEFMKDPLYKTKSCLYFGEQEIYSDEEAL